MALMSASRRERTDASGRGQAMTLVRPSAEPPPLDRDYWIAHSEGFRVDGGDGGRIGFVEATRPDPEQPGRTLLVIRAGALGRRVVVARADDVAVIAPRAERIWLSTSAALLR
jgi:hypothetical protein